MLDYAGRSDNSRIFKLWTEEGREEPNSAVIYRWEGHRWVPIGEADQARVARLTADLRDRLLKATETLGDLVSHSFGIAPFDIDMVVDLDPKHARNNELRATLIIKRR